MTDTTNALQDEAVNDPGIPKVGLHTLPTGDVAGIALALALSDKRGHIVAQWTAIHFDHAAELRDSLTTLLDGIDHPASG